MNQIVVNSDNWKINLKNALLTKTKTLYSGPLTDPCQKQKVLAGCIGTRSTLGSPKAYLDDRTAMPPMHGGSIQNSSYLVLMRCLKPGLLHNRKVRFSSRPRKLNEKWFTGKLRVEARFDSLANTLVPNTTPAVLLLVCHPCVDDREPREDLCPSGKAVRGQTGSLRHFKHRHHNAGNCLMAWPPETDIIF